MPLEMFWKSVDLLHLNIRKREGSEDYRKTIVCSQLTFSLTVYTPSQRSLYLLNCWEQGLAQEQEQEQEQAREQGQEQEQARE